MRWQHPRRMLLVKNSPSSPRHSMEVSQKSKPSSEISISAKGKRWVADMKPSKSTTALKEFTEIDGNSKSHSMNWIEAKARIRVEQDVDLASKNLKLKTSGQPSYKMLLTTGKRYKHYKTNEDRMNLKEGLFFGKYYGETVSVNYYQILIPYQLNDEILRSLHWEFEKHPGITKTITAYRQK